MNTYTKKKEHLQAINELIAEYGECKSLWQIKNQLEACIKYTEQIQLNVKTHAI